MKTLREIHLIHHTHTDFGYTDLPKTTFRLHSEYIRKAIALVERFRNYPEEAQFRWTLEVLLPVGHFLRTATATERKAFFHCLDTGSLDLAAMPCHITPLVGEVELEEVFERFAPLLKRYQPQIALLNDINGFPWGLIPTLVRRGIETLWMGVNLCCAPAVGETPSFRWWEGPDGSRLLLYLSHHYCEGYFWFHQEEWRRGPVPASTNVWHHAPEPGQIWNTSEKDLAAAHAILQGRQKALLESGYPLDVVALQVTNMWRMDNDPPNEGLPDFVRAWNAAGYEPRLRLSTCSQFMRTVRDAGVDFPVVHGDWQDWWADGVASTPMEVSLVRSTQRDFQDLRSGAKYLGVPWDRALKKRISETAVGLVLSTEHTWGGYASAARPYEPLSVGANLQKRALIYQAWEDTADLKARILRGSSTFRPFSKTRALAVLNPGKTPRSGWIEIEAAALRQPALAVRCLETGAILPLETIFGPECMPTDEATPDIYEFPKAVWPIAPLKRRFFLPRVLPGKLRFFELLDAADSIPHPPRASNVELAFNTQTGLPSRLRFESHDLLDGDAPHAFGEIVLETINCTVAQRDLLYRRADDLSGHWKYHRPQLKEFHPEASFYGERWRAVWSDPIAHRIEQLWDIFYGLSRIELTTTFWLKENGDPLAIYLSFPLRLPGARILYDSLGIPTQFGAQQMPGTCGEYAAIGSGIVWESPQLRISMTSPDAPLGVADSLATRQRRLVFTPRTQRFYSMIANNYWITNFPILQAGKIVIRHIFDFGSEADALAACGSLWAFPANPDSLSS